jgi:hypothetical protein
MNELARLVPALEAIANGQPTREAPPETIRAASWSELDLRPLTEGIDLEPAPAMLLRTDGIGLLYRGKLHAFNAEPESCKGWLALWACSEQITAGQHVVYIDFEDEPATAVSRLLALGLGAEAIVERFHYVRPDEPFDQLARETIKPLLALGPALVVIDGLTEALTLDAVELKDNGAIARWYRNLPRHISGVGAAVLMLDHVTKDREGRGRFALGAQHKLAGIDVAFALEVCTPFGREMTGHVKLGVTKDRPGHLRRHAVGKRIADVTVTSTEDGTVTIAVDAPETHNGAFRPTVLMGRVHEAIAATPGISKNAIRASVQGKNEAKDLALELLVGEGYVEVRREGQSHCHHAVRDYSEGGAE